MRRWELKLSLLLLVLTAANLSYNEVIWEESYKLDWADFSHNHQNEHYAALTASGISFSYTAKETTYDMEIFAVFDKDESWVNTQKASKKLLKHEQLHFDITELWTRKMRKAVSQTVYIDDDILNDLYVEHIQGLSKMQAFYDEESHHSLNNKMQQEWESGVKQELAKLSDYTSISVIKSRPIVAQGN
jgi:hypothetical protein